VLLEKVRSLEAELSELKGRQPGGGGAKPDPAARALLKERLALVKELADGLELGHQSGSVSSGQLLQAREAVLKAELDLCESDRERVAVLEKLVAAAKEGEERLAAVVQAGQASHAVLVEAKLKRLEVEIALQRAKQK
jgi:hypothetical protein